MRPRYETQYDSREEARFSEILAERFRCSLHKLPIRYGLDFSAVRDGRVVAFVETKVRTNPVGQYPTYMISVGKFMYADTLTRVTGLDCILAVKWSDAWGHTNLVLQPDIEVTIGGRRDRGDEQDIEPVCLIPIAQFKITPLQAPS
jgi:hypothetical protein